MKKRTKILIVIIVVWSAIALVDYTATRFLGSPILCIPLLGGDVIEYIGLGYMIEAMYPLVEYGEQSVYYHYNFWTCIIGISIFAIPVVYDLIKLRSKTNS